MDDEVDGGGDLGYRRNWKNTRKIVVKKRREEERVDEDSNRRRGKEE
jgi:hypothetical protein